VRWLLVAAVAALSSLGVVASELPLAEQQAVAKPSVVTEQLAVMERAAGAEGAAGQVPVSDSAVILTPIPTPPPVIELLTELKPVEKLHPAKKLKLAKRKPVKDTMFSRSARHQMALLAAKPRAGDPSIRDFFDDEDVDFGASDLDFHRSFSRPKVKEVADRDEDDDADISEAVKLRLFVARMKAVQAHEKKFAQAEDNHADIPEAVKLRLFLARMKAVQAHQKKFS